MVLPGSRVERQRQIHPISLIVRERALATLARVYYPRCLQRSTARQCG
jgi:hypothetical protein